ncbi:MAG: extracellular solute-binding protein [Candidatus Zixiibacteriota bacterium]
MRLILSLCLVLVLWRTPCPAAQATIGWWQFWTDPEIKPTINAIVAEFQRQNPDIEVIVTDLTWANGHEKIAIAFASGSAPDVVELGSDWIAQFAASGHLADLTDSVTPRLEEYHGWSMATYQGRIYAQPWILGTRVLFLNRQLLSKAGYNKDFLPVSWAQLEEAARKVKSLPIGVYGWGSNTAEKHRLYKKFMPFFWSSGAHVLSDDGRYCVVSAQSAVDALKFYKRLHDCCGYVADQRGIEEAFLEGKVGMIISGDWLLKRIELEKREIDFATSMIPGPDPAVNLSRPSAPMLRSTPYPGRSFGGGEFLAINAASANKDAALKLIQFVASPENQVSFCKANRSANPSSLQAQLDRYFQDNLYLQTFIKQLNLSEHPPVDPDWVYMEAEIEKAVEEVLFHDSLPGQTLYRLQKSITELRRK